MAVKDATPFPVKNQAYRLYLSFFNISSGAVITGWTGAIANAFSDGAAGVSCTIAESPAASGNGYIDIPAGSMNASEVSVIASVTNSNAIPCVVSLIPLDLTDYASPNGAFDEQYNVRFEQMVQNILAFCLFQVSQSNGQYTVNTRSGSQKFQGTYSESTSGATKGNLS